MHNMKSTGLVAGFSALAATNAFLLPSTTTPQPEFAKSIDQLTQPDSRLIKLNCPGCSVPEEGNQIEGDNSLVLEFTLEYDNKALRLNGALIYPGLPSPFTPATQTSSDTSFEALQDTPSEVTTDQRWLSFGSTLNSIIAADGTDSELVDIKFQITALGDEAVNVDSLDIRLLKAEDGTLGIGDIVQVTPESTPSMPTMDEGEALFEIKPIDTIIPIEAKPPGCAAGMPDVICRMRDVMVSRLEMLRQKAHHIPSLFDKQSAHRKPCPGMLRKLAAAKAAQEQQEQQGEAEPQHDASAPHRHHHHHHPHMHVAVHRFIMGLRRIVFGFVIPVMIGIAAGMTASLVGMVFGTLIAYVWIRFVRKGKKGSASRRVRLEEAVVTESDGEVVAEEKRGLMSDVDQADVEAPPQYVEKE